MNYTVLWTAEAERKLTLLWMQSKDRQSITSAVNFIDQLLSQHPESLGTVNFDTVRTFTWQLVGVEFEVIEADRIVYVLGVWATYLKS